jgi:hypothetical protein
LGPPPCQPGWPASPCTCNGLWLISHMAVSLKENNWFLLRIKLHAHYSSLTYYTYILTGVAKASSLKKLSWGVALSSSELCVNNWMT